MAGVSWPVIRRARSNGLHLVEVLACMSCRQWLPGLLHVVPVMA